ncbi:MAG: P1 family peptidase [Deltaproteobacteria bacterium]|nr:P1 family peptidase [Deltaproteobacteria bacterium]
MLAKEKKREEEKGSCVFVIATDAPVDARNLERMAERTALSLGRVGSYASNGSGDYALAFSTHPKMRIKHGSKMTGAPVVSNAAISPLFEAVIEAGEEAIVNSLFMAERVVGRDGHTIDPLPVDRVMELMKTR